MSHWSERNRVFGWVYATFYERWWTMFYCKRAHFYLMRHTETGEFIIVYSRSPEPRVTGFDLVVEKWTPRGCIRAARDNVSYERLVDRVGGPDAMLKLIRDAGR